MVWDQGILYMCVKVSSNQLKLNLDFCQTYKNQYFKFNLRVTIRPGDGGARF